MRILMVCLGNICRSPMAEGLLRHHLNLKGRSDILVDSAGTGGWHQGEGPDPRAQKTCLEAGIDISQQRARKISSDDLRHFDRILALDRSIYDDLMRLKDQHPTADSKIELYLQSAGYPEPWDVADPWSGTIDDFKAVYQLLDEASGRLTARLLDENRSEKD